MKPLSAPVRLQLSAPCFAPDLAGNWALCDPLPDVEGYFSTYPPAVSCCFAWPTNMQFGNGYAAILLVAGISAAQGTPPDRVVPSAARIVLPGAGLAEHPFLYCGEWQQRGKSEQTMYLVRG